LEYIKTARTKVGLRPALVPVTTLTELFVASRYGGVEVAEEQVLQARQAFLDLKRALSRKASGPGKTKV